MGWPGVPGRTGEEEEKSSPLTSRSCTAGPAGKVDMQRPDAGRQKLPPPATAPMPLGAGEQRRGSHLPAQVQGEASLGSRGPSSGAASGKPHPFLGSGEPRGQGSLGPAEPRPRTRWARQDPILVHFTVQRPNLVPYLGHDGTELKLSKVRILVLLHTRLSWAGCPPLPHQG